MSMAVLPRVVRAADESIADEQIASRLLGSWLDSAGQMSIVFSLEPGGQTLVLFDENGALTIGRHGWRPLPGGVLIDSVPRFRLWHSSGACEVRVEMEELSNIEISEGVRHFPRRFCMKRVVHAPIPKELIARPLPKGWERETAEE